MNSLKPLKYCASHFAILLILAIFSFSEPLFAEWSKPIDIAPSSDFRGDVAMDSRSNATFLNTNGSSIFSYSLPNGGNWSAPTTIFNIGKDSELVVKNLLVFLDSEGNKIAVWGCGSPNGTSVKRIFASRQSRDSSSWSALPMSLDISPSAEMPTINFVSDPQGNIVASWKAYDKHHQSVIVASAILSADQSAWSNPVILETYPSERSSDFPEMKIVNETAFIIWLGANANQLSWTTYDFSTKKWNSLSTIELPSLLFKKLSYICIGADSQLNIAAIVQGQLVKNQKSAFYTMSLNRSTRLWSDLQPLSDPNHEADFALIETNDKGNLYAIWSEYCNTIESKIQTMKASSLSIQGEWTPAVCLLPPQEIYFTSFDLKLDSSGNVLASWVSNDLQKNSTNILQYCFKPQNKNWSPVSDLADNSDWSARLSLNNQGVALAVWVDLAKLCLTSSFNKEIFINQTLYQNQQNK
jgi:hypothetical protein